MLVNSWNELTVICKKLKLKSNRWKFNKKNNKFLKFSVHNLILEEWKKKFKTTVKSFFTNKPNTDYVYLFQTWPYFNFIINKQEKIKIWWNGYFVIGTPWFSYFWNHWYNLNSGNTCCIITIIYFAFCLNSFQPCEVVPRNQSFFRDSSFYF